MLRRLFSAPPDDVDADPIRSDPGTAPDADRSLAPDATEPGLAALPIAGITRRRMATIVAGVVAAWIVIVFARQVGAASAAMARADDIAAANAGLRVEISTLARELDQIGHQRYIEQQARGYGLGTSREIPFTLAADAPPLPADAPGSAAARVGAGGEPVTPLERWLTVLFGPSG